MAIRLSLATLAAVAILASGCIRSKVVITSSPEQADVFVNSAPRGRTPIEIPIAWYWYYDIEVAKKGYLPVETTERFRAPFWAVFPLDLLAEAFPWRIPDTRYRHYVLKPRPDL